MCHFGAGSRAVGKEKIGYNNFIPDGFAREWFIRVGNKIERWDSMPKCILYPDGVGSVLPFLQCYISFKFGQIIFT
jgi:hypothetical protein